LRQAAGFSRESASRFPRACLEVNERQTRARKRTKEARKIDSLRVGEYFRRLVDAVCSAVAL
jgi:hypothetical protein